MPASSAGRLCVFVSGEANKSEYFERLVAVSSSWGRREWLPANTSLHYVMSAHGISNLFDRAMVAETMSALHARAMGVLRPHFRTGMQEQVAAGMQAQSIRNDQLVILNGSTSLLERREAPVRTEWLLREIHDRFVKDNLCDWLLLAEDDSYVELPAVRRVIEARLAPQAREHHYCGIVRGDEYGDFVQRDFLLFNRAAFTRAYGSLARCKPTQVGWGDSWLGGCIRLAEGWIRFPHTAVDNTSDYWRNPDMRPEPWPARHVSMSHTVVEDLLAARINGSKTNRWMVRATHFNKLSAIDILTVHTLLRRKTLLRRSW